MWTTLRSGPRFGSDFLMKNDSPVTVALIRKVKAGREQEFEAALHEFVSQTVNLQGQLVGIPTLGAINTETNTTANGVSFAIPSNLVKTVVQQILQQ